MDFTQVNQSSVIASLALAMTESLSHARKQVTHALVLAMQPASWKLSQGMGMISSIDYLRIVMRISLIIILCAFMPLSWATADFEQQQILQRIKPVGSVRVEPDANAPAAQDAVAAQPVAKKALTGQELYDKYCVVCHKTGLAGAPKFRDEADWKPRLDAKKLDGLVASSIKGLNAMPAKGTCSECSEADMKLAIQYMLPQP